MWSALSGTFDYSRSFCAKKRAKSARNNPLCAKSSFARFLRQILDNRASPRFYASISLMQNVLPPYSCSRALFVCHLWHVVCRAVAFGGFFTRAIISFGLLFRIVKMQNRRIRRWHEMYRLRSSGGRRAAKILTRIVSHSFSEGT